MGELYRLKTPENPGEDGNFLSQSISNIDRVLFNKPGKWDNFKQIRLYASSVEPPAYIQINGSDLEIYAPLDWIDDVRDIASEENDEDFAALVKAYMLTTICVKAKINSLDNNQERTTILNVDPKTKYKVGHDKFEVEYHNSRDVQLWQASSAIAVKTVTKPKSPERQQLLDFVRTLADEELVSELKTQGFSPYKDMLVKLFMAEPIYYEIYGYQYGCLSPLDDQALLRMSAGFMLSANS